MRQILFEIPIHDWFGIGWNIPIHGYGFMLFLAFVGCTWLASRLAKRQGIPPELIQDLAIYLFVFGIAGARLTYVLQYYYKFESIWQVFAIWDGGLVFYGSAIGGLVGFAVAYRVLLKKHNISFFKMADVVAPCVALGLALGRIGCLLNGCCYGGVACPECLAIHFPLSSEPRHVLVSYGYQTAAGFTLADDDPASPATVGQVEPGSPAERAGLKSGDEIIEAEGSIQIHSVKDLSTLLNKDWKRGDNDLQVKISRTRPGGGTEEIELPPFIPWSIGIHPTQIYETISTSLLLFFLLSYMPFRRNDGELLVILIIAYSIHRFINEVIRIDTETWFAGMTISQNISVVLLVVGVGLGLWLRKQPPDYGPDAKMPATDPAESQTSEAESPLTALQD